MGSTETFLSGFGCIDTKMLVIRPCWTLPEGKLRMHLDTWPKRWPEVITVSWSARPHAAALSSYTFRSRAISGVSSEDFQIPPPRCPGGGPGKETESHECGEKRKALFSNKWLEMRYDGKTGVSCGLSLFLSICVRSPSGAHVGSEAMRPVLKVKGSSRF